jgi:hypothetical protein
MRSQLLATAALVLVAAGPALARDRPVTDLERPKLAAAVAAEGCSGGRAEFDIDDDRYEVDDAICSDGRRYDLEFDTAFRLTSKELED